MAYSWQQNLVDIAQVVYYDQAPAFIGVTANTLDKWIKSKSTPSPASQKLIAKAATLLRRRIGQKRGASKAQEQREIKRKIHAHLAEIGKPDIPLPDYLPPFLRYHAQEATGMPVYIYDFRQIKKAKQVEQFFRFMKTVLPGGSFFFTCELKKAGIEHRKSGTFFSDELLKKLMEKRGVSSPVQALIIEYGSPLAGSPIQRVVGGFVAHGLQYVSTKWQPFCTFTINDTCEMLTDFGFVEIWLRENDRSKGKRVIECGISQQKPLTFTPEEVAQNIARGADPVTGIYYIWND